jgi:hypothetical protein
MRIIILFTALCALGTVMAEETQLTFSAKNHNLDNNDNFSPDDTKLVYDTRGELGPGIGNSQTIEMVDLASGAETILYKPKNTILSPDESASAPGVGAVSFHPKEDKVIFIHGPFVEEIEARGYYRKPNRKGAIVPADGSMDLTWADARDTSTDGPTTPGAHRGGTHRHEWTLSGNRIGFTYDDVILTQYDRTVGYMEPNAKAPEGATHYFANLVSVVPKGTSKPGEIEKAFGDSWVGPQGEMRGFTGTVRQEDGSYEDCLFVIDLPLSVDITTADSGGPDRFPAPPEGVSIRRLTHTWAGGVIRGSHDGRWIAYLGKDANDVQQLFIIDAHGSDKSDDPALRPRQLTDLAEGVDIYFRWHPEGQYLCGVSEGGIFKVDLEDGKLSFLTPKADGEPRLNLVFSHDGKVLAYNRAMATTDTGVEAATNYDGTDFLQIFTLKP